MVQCLLQAEAALDVCCGTLCYTAIHQAAAYGNHAVIADLAAAAPELVHKPNSKGDTPIINGVATHNSKVTEKLLEFDADPNQVGSYGHSVLALSSLHTSRPAIGFGRLRPQPPRKFEGAFVPCSRWSKYTITTGLTGAHL